MKKILFALSIMALFAISCSDGAEAKQQEEALKAEITELDSLSNDLETTIEGIEAAGAAVEAALGDLDL
jgi:PBP1b-binding outer membrane lipoprotein LpoB